MRLRTDRPLAHIDAETTGVNPRTDRIVELAVLVEHVDGHLVPYTWRVNPGIEIPEEATAIHGISNADVRYAPHFSDVADDVLRTLDGCDFAGFNLIRFDLPLLEAEMERAGCRLDIEGRRVIDAQVIYHREDPRTLEAAVLKYTGEVHADAHGAMADARASCRVLMEQLSVHRESVPPDIDDLHAYCERGTPLKYRGWFRLNDDGGLVFNRGKFRGVFLSDVAGTNPGYLRWLAFKAEDMPEAVREVAVEALES